MAAAEKFPVTLLVIARDEAAVIGRCLDSVPFADEKLVVDSGSTDGTQQIAAAHGARVIHHEWILALDADEALSPKLVQEMQEKLPRLLQSSAAGAILRRSTWYMGAPMRWYRPMVGERLGRLYHRGRARWTDARVHESLRFSGPTESFRHPFIHLHNPTLVHRYLKTVRYAELKARDWLDRGRAVRMWLCPLVFVAAFFKDYVLRLAFLDGW